MIYEYKAIGWRWKYSNPDGTTVGGDVIFNLPIPEDIAERAKLAEFSRTAETVYAESPIVITQDQIEEYVCQEDVIRVLREENERLTKENEEMDLLLKELQSAFSRAKAARQRWEQT